MRTDDLWPAYTPPARFTDPNPLVRKHGYGPEGATCRDCDELLRVRHCTKTYRKCERRGVTHGAGTDHCAKWRACAFYVPSASVREQGEAPKP